jgi:hypothetical protein
MSRLMRATSRLPREVFELDLPESKVVKIAEFASPKQGTPDFTAFQEERKKIAFKAAEEGWDLAKIGEECKALQVKFKCGRDVTRSPGKAQKKEKLLLLLRGLKSDVTFGKTRKEVVLEAEELENELLAEGAIPRVEEISI